jgi:hypothetical protein
MQVQVGREANLQCSVLVLQGWLDRVMATLLQAQVPFYCVAGYRRVQQGSGNESNPLRLPIALHTHPRVCLETPTQPHCAFLHTRAVSASWRDCVVGTSHPSFLPRAIYQPFMVGRLHAGMVWGAQMNNASLQPLSSSTCGISDQDHQLQ